MAKKMLPDVPCRKQLQIYAQESLQLNHYKVSALLKRLLHRTDLNECPATELHTYLCVIDDLSDESIVLSDKIISGMAKWEQEIEDDEEWI